MFRASWFASICRYRFVILPSIARVYRIERLDSLVWVLLADVYGGQALLRSGVSLLEHLAAVRGVELPWKSRNGENEKVQSMKRANS